MTAALPELTARQLNRTTLLRQSLLERSTDGTVAAVGRLAGLQAQYPNSPYVALWSRVDGFAIADLERALDERSVVKATVMRGTLHLVSAADYPAFSVASSVARIANWRPSADRVGVRTADLHHRLLAYCAEPRTIAEMEADLETLVPDSSIVGKVPAGVRHVAFRMADAHGWLVHVPPSGRWDSFAKPRYVDASVWLPGAERPSPEDALRIAIERYLPAYGPASVADIGKWVGQPRLPQVRAALEAFGGRVRLFGGPDGRELVDLDGAPLATGDERAPVRFLARWDSILIGYERRERILPAAIAGDVIRSTHGDFLPSFTVEGWVAGTWSVADVSGRTVVTLSPSIPLGTAARNEVAEEAERLGRFLARSAGRHVVVWEG